MKDKIRYGMIGGGQGANIGPVHRYAARIDNEYDLICGVFSRSKENSRETGLSLGIDPARIYDSYQQLFDQEARLPASQRVQVITVVTPNASHFAISQAAIEKGFHVLCEKPVTCSLEEAQQLKKLILEKDTLFCINFTKAAYPMIKQMRTMIKANQIGSIRKIFIDYRVSGLEFDVEHSQNKQAKWRIDPQESGPTGTLGDVGSHAFHLMEYITGLSTAKLCAHMDTLMPNRVLDDDNTILLKFNNGANGLITATQVLPGEIENLAVAVYGEKGGIKWHIHKADQLELYWQDRPMQILRAGIDKQYLDESVLQSGRIPGGRDEGHIGAIANHYRIFAQAIHAKATGHGNEQFDYPTITDGIRNMAFIATALLSSSLGGKWLDFPNLF